jgi:hypothetical protein
VSTNQIRHRTSLPPRLLIATSAAVMFAAGGGVAVLEGADHAPQWMWTTAVAVATALGIAYVAGTTEWALDRRTTKRVCTHIAAGRLHDATADLQAYVTQLENLCGRYDPLTLRWTFTLAHLLLHTGQRMRGMALLALVIDGQLAVLGPTHPETHRSLRLQERHTDVTAPIAPVERWWA